MSENEIHVDKTLATPGVAKPLRLAVPLLALIVLLAWLALTPGGLLGKADAVGYAVCHRIASHSFFFGDRQLPLCARCSGMHLGALLALAYQVCLGKRGGMPSKKVLVVLGVFLLAFAVDGLNSYLTLGQESGSSISLFANFQPLYIPMNWLRALTGIMMGLGIGAMLYPIFNQTMYKEWDPRPSLSSWRDLFQLLGLSILLEAALLSNNVFFLYPLAILSSLTVLLILSMIYAIVWAMIMKQENVFSSLQQSWMILLLGFTTAVLQIGIMDYGRFMLTGTWKGFGL
ncbi:MAG: DUF2085 domain-containing protein [Chloroflexi bacterium]|nr:DUF2085 domain-containing protein [Chloroflexota bacterium]